jgi:hypothetical protein
MKAKWFGRILAIVFFLIGTFYLSRSCAHAASVWDEYLHGGAHILTIEECVQKIEFHKGESQRIYEEVKDRCWWLPTLDDRQKARRMFQLIIPAVSACGITGKIVATGYTLFGQYGLDCLDEWDWIQNKWHWLEYHADQSEFYERYLIHSARLLRYQEEQ